MDPYASALWLWIAAALMVAPIIFLKTAPYGRHAPASARLTISSRMGWLLMESPSALGIALMFGFHPPEGLVPWLLLGLWELHYVNRTFIYPFRMRTGERPMPLAIVASAFVFTSVNSFFNGFHLTHVRYEGWVSDPRFWIGGALFLFGFAINQLADRTLRNLRAPGEHAYRIPQGGLYRLVSCPNYLGEILEWTGWTVASWSLEGAAFALWTIANLLPRALAHHRWYQEKFADYPRERRALIPYLL